MAESLKKIAAETMDEIQRRWYALRNQGLDFSEYQIAAKDLSEAKTEEDVLRIKDWLGNAQFKENISEIEDYFRDFKFNLVLAYFEREIGKLAQNDEIKVAYLEAKQAVDAQSKNAIITMKRLRKEIGNVSK